MNLFLLHLSLIKFNALSDMRLIITFIAHLGTILRFLIWFLNLSTGIDPSSLDFPKHMQVRAL